MITEKIDGTNGLISIHPYTGAEEEELYTLDVVDDLSIRAGSRNRWLTQVDDNFGFARWVQNNSEELMQLGEGSHYGEWWGQGIQRGYDQPGKRFSLFNTKRWNGDGATPDCVSVVPVLHIVTGERLNWAVGTWLADLADNGSRAAPGFMNPEGLVVFHTASGAYYKVPFEQRAKSLPLAA